MEVGAGGGQANFDPQVFCSVIFLLIEKGATFFNF